MPPEHAFRIGDRVRCPTGRIAKVIGLRADGKLDGQYETDPYYTGRTTLDPQLVKSIKVEQFLTKTPRNAR